MFEMLNKGDLPMAQTQIQTEIEFDSRINHAPPDFDARKELPKGFYEFLEMLHREFTLRQQELARKRIAVLKASHNGDLPNHLPNNAAAKGDWKITLPKYIADQRNQMTGPADDGELVVKMLNSGAPGVMIDLEDSMANVWENLEKGIENAISALHGELTYYDKKREKETAIKESATVILTRLRGLHLSQANVFPNELLSASVYDAARIAFGVDKAKLKHNLTFYIPKSESAEEGLFWRDLFQTIEAKLGWERGFIKCFALVEAHPFAYQMEEFLYHLRELSLIHI